MRAAVYAGTPNLYGDMIPAIKSLMMHSDVDRIYLLIRDDAFPGYLPPEVETVNVSSQKWFPEGGPNYYSIWSHLILLRVALPKLFPDLDRILSLDVDTIVDRDISDLWELDLGDNFVAAVREPEKSSKQRLYINAGVMMMNLKLLRETGMDDMMIEDLNHTRRIYPEQDCISQLCSGYILELEPKYNASICTAQPEDPCIYHYAAQRFWQGNPEVLKYKQIEWSEIERRKK